MSELTEVRTLSPAYNRTSGMLSIPMVTGVAYYFNGVAIGGNFVIHGKNTVTAEAKSGYILAQDTDNEWVFVGR